jgi:hypothetical protein
LAGTLDRAFVSRIFLESIKTLRRFLVTQQGSVSSVAHELGPVVLDAAWQDDTRAAQALSVSEYACDRILAVITSPNYYKPILVRHSHQLSLSATDSER